MLSKSKYNEAISIGQFVAYDLFVFMLNPKNRGERFTWKSLYKMVEGAVSATIKISSGASGKQLEGMIGVALDSAKGTIKSCLNESGVEEWINL